MYRPYKKTFLAVWCTAILLWPCVCVHAKSLYVVSFNEFLRTFKVDKEKLIFQAQCRLPLHGIGTIGVAIDDEAGIIFVGHEGSPHGAPGKVIEIYNESLAHIDSVELTGPSDIAGLVYDKAGSRLIASDRINRKIWLIDWDAQTLTLDTNPTNVNLEGIRYKPVGLALNDNILYVSDYWYPPGFTKSVHLYDMNDNFSLIDSINMGNKVVGIAYSSKDDVIYGGAYDYAGSYHHLIKRSVDPNTTIEKDVGAGTIGVTTDDDTGLVYLTTYRNGGSIEVYDTSGWTGSPSSVDPNFIYDSDNDDGVVISNLAGLAVGPEFVPPFEPNIADDIDDCVSPCDGQITYTITLSQEWAEEWIPKMQDFDKLKIVDEMPEELDFVEELNDPNWQYSASSRTATWWIHDPNFWDWSDSIALTLQVNRDITPGGTIENVFKEVIVYSLREDQFNIGTVETEVCDCGGCVDIIYVDTNVSVAGDGSSWTEAFDDLQDALGSAWPCDQIWVAEGEYKVTNDPCDTDATFDIPDWVAVLGGFEGGPEGETEHYERNWADPCKVAVLRGDIDSYGDEPNCVDYVLTCDSDVEIAWLDGFTIRGGGIAGIYCEGSSPIIQHNKITDSGAGIYCFESKQPVIKNNWLYKNDCGMYFNEPEDAPVVRNNTIADNIYYGISASETDPNISISNCIIWGNGTQLNLDFVPTYSCIQNWTQGGTENISSDPCFVSAGTDDYLLKSVSACIDAGDPCDNYGGERDIDKHFRVLDGDGVDGKRVDMGADEYCNEGSSNAADFNNDKIVDTNDLVEMAAAWLIDSNDPDWESQYAKYNLNTDDVINYGDFACFAKEWLWMTCDKMQGYEMMEMMMGMGGGMYGMMGGESMLMAEPAESATSQETQSEPTIEGQIDQLQKCLDFVEKLWQEDEGVKEAIDEETWDGFIASLEEMLKDLEE